MTTISQPADTGDTTTKRGGREDRIAAGRHLLDILEATPELPVPDHFTIALALMSDTDANQRLDQIEAALDAAGITRRSYSTDFSRGLELTVGPVTYCISHIWARAWQDSLARNSYSAVVQTGQAGSGQAES